METTIAVKQSTLQLLTQLKKKLEAQTMDETIVKIVHKAEKISSSRFGSQPSLKKFTEKERGNSRDI